jgi:hypothetical protein
LDIDVTPVNGVTMVALQSITNDEDIPVDILLTDSDTCDSLLISVVIASPTNGILNGGHST